LKIKKITLIPIKKEDDDENKLLNPALYWSAIESFFLYLATSAREDMTFSVNSISRKKLKTWQYYTGEIFFFYYKSSDI